MMQFAATPAAATDADDMQPINKLVVYELRAHTPLYCALLITSYTGKWLSTWSCADVIGNMINLELTERNVARFLDVTMIPREFTLAADAQSAAELFTIHDGDSNNDGIFYQILSALFGAKILEPVSFETSGKTPRVTDLVFRPGEMSASFTKVWRSAAKPVVKEVAEKTAKKVVEELTKTRCGKWVGVKKNGERFDLEIWRSDPYEINGNCIWDLTRKRNLTGAELLEELQKNGINIMEVYS
jgi:hypothetical protein